MKKMIWMVAGLCVVVGAVLWVGRERAPDAKSESAECTSCPECSTSGGGTTSVSSKDGTEPVPPNVGGAGRKACSTVDHPGKGATWTGWGKSRTIPPYWLQSTSCRTKLWRDDLEALMEMLAWSNDRFPEGMRPIEINAVKNDVLDKLLRQEILPEGLGLQMAEMAGNVNNDPVWRDYCVQFMGPFYERRSQLNCRTSKVLMLEGRALFRPRTTPRSFLQMN